jgi:ferredoxin
MEKWQKERKQHEQGNLDAERRWCGGTGEYPMNSIVIDRDLCTRCGTCSTVCPSGIIAAAGQLDLPHVPKAAAVRCNRCGHCEAFCPTGALAAVWDECEGDAAAADSIGLDILGR